MAANRRTVELQRIWSDHTWDPEQLTDLQATDLVYSLLDDDHKLLLSEARVYWVPEDDCDESVDPDG